MEVIVRRLPYAQCHVITKRADDEDFGLETSGNEITRVSGPAEVAGLTALTSAADPMATPDARVTWSVTELNGRPVNVFDGGVREKLGAVGCDVSIVVQPTDFVASLRKKLRSSRGHKAFVAQ